MKQHSDSLPNPTINDIARVAEVSLATVDRVLNARPGVREVTVKKVNNAIAQLGYVRDTAAANLARGRIYNFTFILPSNENEFLSLLETQIRMLDSSMRHERTKLTFVRVAAFDPIALAQAIDAIDPASVDGVAIFGPETPSVRDSVAHLKAHGVTVVSLVADIPSSERDNYIGVDNIAAGRTAAQLLGRFLGRKQGKILVLTGSMLARDHLERRLGFDEVMGRDFPDLEVLASLEGRDDPELIQRLLPEAFVANHDVIGVYSSAAGNDGLLRYFETHPDIPRPVVVAHELTPLSRSALAQGRFDAVISQDAGHLVRSAVRIMRANTDGMPINLAQERIRIDVYLKENMPP
ncbi:Transcriptional regulator, LacI family [Sulfitobacter noctilucicola]|uniref:LacI family transcriptional regulator n=1 Tax=Sulfitobacter noctilucicola TaxID=1342301 RepID=A0A7W6M9L6_9RHOB|nr:LacI family DNA-binding transcriptional regulator [Sulfitobacter noctilucicola]KIN63503.1 Transcriptional regulator, LacI family [Sulfitobacter noctilucicola]MBB4174986.1 LacI family transcriptional regulator [Sulfitobacter noctilucicola]